MHTAPRPCVQRRVAARTGQCPALCRGPCRRTCRSVHWLCRRPCRPPCHRPPVTIQNLYRDTNPCRAHCMPCCCAHEPWLSPCHDTKNCIATHPCGQAPRARYPSPLRVGRPCRSAAALCRRVVSQRFWPYRTWPCAPSCLVARYNLLYRDPKLENGQ